MGFMAFLRAALLRRGDVEPPRSPVELVRGVRRDLSHDYSLGVRDVIWQEVPAARSAISALEDDERVEAGAVAPQENPYQYLFELKVAVFDPSVWSGNVSLVEDCMRAFERVLAIGSELVDESFEWVFLKELRRRSDTLGESYGPLLQRKVMSPRD
ncbi:hypothetical protein [Sphaerisporangium fuscum]|uniref:hypothetical protein n=1 Tax=Sphaerisporangium fuscum TaxID=2835868 RepID=UPI001BDDB2A4|nr:hypothetical protein [Sphaerisporangium fuscum]